MPCEEHARLAACCAGERAPSKVRFRIRLAMVSGVPVNLGDGAAFVDYRGLTSLNGVGWIRRTPKSKRVPGYEVEEAIETTEVEI